jgi:hypothetical protein
MKWNPAQSAVPFETTADAADLSACVRTSRICSAKAIEERMCSISVYKNVDVAAAVPLRALSRGTKRISRI